MSDELHGWYESGADPAPVVEPHDPDRGYAGRRDPLATYFGLRDLKALKRVGFMEVLRGLPWLLAENFNGRVPDDMVASVEEGIVEVPCTCEGKPTTEVRFNAVAPCSGDCGRWFWYIAGEVRVGYDPDRRTAPNA